MSPRILISWFITFNCNIWSHEIFWSGIN